MANRLDHLRVISELDNLVATVRDVDELARRAVAHICATTQREVAVLLCQPNDVILCWSSAPTALPTLLIPGLPARVNPEDAAGRVFQTGLTNIVVEATYAVVAVPLKAMGDELLGVLQLQSDLTIVNDQSQVVALETLARRLALSIANLQAVRTVSEQAARIQTLQRLTNQMTATLDIQAVYRAIYDSVRTLMDCDAFFIALYDEKTTAYDYVLCIMDGATVPPVRVPARNGLIDHVIRTRQSVSISDVNREMPFELVRWGDEHRTQALLCAPMMLGDRAFGALSVQSYWRDAYTPADLEILTIFAGQAAIAINNAHLFDEMQRKVKQLAMLNEVGRIISSTMDMNRLFDLIYGQVTRVVPSDTYYFGLVDLERRIIELKFIVDEGERFPPQTIRLDEGLSGIVVERRAPLLLRNLPEDIDRLPVRQQIVGTPRQPVSWLGVPVMTSEHLVGVLAIASYAANAFDEEDLEILQTVMTQAAIAIDNANHHAQVFEQAQLDSLTQVLNHGSFLAQLRQEVERPQWLAVIMLDIDHFKGYNDTYGHIAGDAILRGTVQAIRANIERTDLVGRWGGEEFAIALLETNVRNARVVAERIRTTLAGLTLVDDQNRIVPVPTVSQGIATMPDDARDAIALIDLADRRLYQAKERGRDQIA